MTTNDVFGAFLQAKEAMDRLPAVEQENDHLKEDIASANDEISRLETRIRALQNSITETNAANDTLRSERDEAMFRELEGRDRLEALVSALKGPAREADTFLNPPQPVAPLVSQSESPSQPGSQSSPVGGYDHGGNDRGFGDSPTPPFVATPVTTGMTTAEEAMPATDTGPFVSTEPSSPPVVTDGVAASTPVSPKPYADKKPWQRPESIPLAEWIDGGGEAPWWYIKGEVESYNDIKY